LTTAANGPVKHLHHRMPVRLPEEQWDDWLNPEKIAGQVIEHMKTGDDLGFHEVSKVVNSGRSQGENLIAKVVD